jgi:hypothetical protein
VIAGSPTRGALARGARSVHKPVLGQPGSRECKLEKGPRRPREQDLPKRAEVTGARLSWFETNGGTEDAQLAQVQQEIASVRQELPLFGCTRNVN